MLGKNTFWQEVTRCDYCGGDDFSLYLRSDKPNWYRQQPLIIEQCTACGLAMANPRPDRNIIYQDFANAGARAQKAVDRKLGRPNVIAVHKAAVERAMGFCQHEPKTLFDMGCGAGTILQSAKSLGLTAEANEINLASVNRLTQLGFKVYHGFTRDLDLPANRYDIVINFDYLEHSYEPYQDLLICNKILEMDGVLYLKTLYLDCPDHIIKQDNYQLFGGGHFHYFPARTLLSMVYRAGFEIVELRMTNLIFIMARKVSQGDAGRPLDQFAFKVIGS